jgi:predicted phosphodiesterase
MMHLPYYLTPDAELVIYGHTHRFASEMKGGTLYLNPGEICAREGELSECVLLERGTDRWHLRRFFRAPDAPRWEEKQLLYPFTESK